MEHLDISYTQHLEWLTRIERRAHAEVQGFRDAKLYKVPRQWSPDENEQKRYEIGFMDGCAKLIIEGVRACEPTPEPTTSI